MFSSGLILGAHECICATSQKRHLTRIFLFTVNYCLFVNSDVSIKFNGKDDNVVLEMRFTYKWSIMHQSLVTWILPSSGKGRDYDFTVFSPLL